MQLNEFAIIIPSYQPDKKLNSVVSGMVMSGFSHIILVDDGSGFEYSEFFNAAIVSHSECILLRHDENRGKGAALRTAFSYVLGNMPYIKTVITVDGDGQHTPDDALCIASAAAADPDKLILGCRDFSAKGVPLHNKLGNNITRHAFKTLCGLKLSDTQTGLRAIPAAFLKSLIAKVSGDRYEYETNMLLYAHENGVGFKEVTIHTVYIEDNKSSHFDVLGDSFKIYRMIFRKSALMRQLISSGICCVVDLALFTALGKAFEPVRALFLQVFLATAIARILSALLNYIINRRFVFKSKAKVGKSLRKYFILAAAQMACSWLLVSALSMLTGSEGFARTLVKLLVDTALFILSFYIQKNWVFKSK